MVDPRERSGAGGAARRWRSLHRRRPWRAGAIAIVSLLGLAAGPPLLLQSDEALAGGAEPTCGDSVDLPWRCIVVQANEVGLIGELMDGACFVPETITFAPWRLDQGSGQVLEYVFTGKQEPFPCVFE